ncbi:MAG: hypothetical protein ACE37K_11170 [Planctomycetota bacterium]
MPITLPSSFASREDPHSADAYVRLLELELERPRLDLDTPMPALLLRSCKWHEGLSWPPSHPESWGWQPWNFSLSVMRRDGEGNLPGLQLSVDNTTGALMRYLHAGAGLEGNTCRLYTVPQSALSIAYPNHEFERWDFEVISATATSRAISIRLGFQNFYEKAAPQDRFTARRCRWPFGSRQCGYVVNSAAAYTTCDKTLGSCIKRGDDHVARGLPRMNPRNFGAFPGVSKQR